MPLDAVVVPGVEDGETGLHRDPGPLEEVLCIVRLGHLVGDELGEVASVGPRVVIPACWRAVSSCYPRTGT